MPICDACGMLVLNLDRPTVLRRAQLVYDTLLALGGHVEKQQELLDVLWEKHRMSHGTAQYLIDALGQRGFLRVRYHGRGAQRKEITAVRRPLRMPRPRRRRRIDDPGFPVRRVPEWYEAPE